MQRTKEREAKQRPSEEATHGCQTLFPGANLARGTHSTRRGCYGLACLRFGAALFTISAFHTGWSTVRGLVALFILHPLPFSAVFASAVELAFSHETLGPLRLSRSILDVGRWKSMFAFLALWSRGPSLTAIDKSAHSSSTLSRQTFFQRL